MYCKKCGKELEKNAQFCTNCGTQVQDSVKEISKDEKEKKGTGIRFGLIVLVGLALCAVFFVVAIILIPLVLHKADSQEILPIASEEEQYYFNEKIYPGDIVTFGNYEQDGDLSNGKEPIEWMVTLDDKGNYILISRYVLDCQPWYVEGGSSSQGGIEHETIYSYENSYVRKWLNEEFVPEAFSEYEKEYIIPTSHRDGYITVESNNPYATDYAFIPSLWEITHYLAKGITVDYSNKKTPKWMCAPTEYAINQGVAYYTFDEMDFTHTTPGLDPIDMGPRYFISDSGYLERECLASWCLRDYSLEYGENRFVERNGCCQYGRMDSEYGIRPAIYIKTEAFPQEDSVADPEMIACLQPYMGTWKREIVYPDNDVHAHVSIYTCLETSGESEYITVDEKYIDLSPFTGFAYDKYPTADFRYEKTDLGWDSFVNDERHIRIIIDKEEGRELFCIQLYSLRAENGWGTDTIFVREESN